LAVITAGLSGARFVSEGTNASSMTMAVAAGAAIGAYALVLLLSAGDPAATRARTDQELRGGASHYPTLSDNRP
ncbi:MAG: hypothetical protein ACRDZT_05120, partial [Acidimicrobiales bacterium]